MRHDHPAGCLWCEGYRDGYRVGPDNIDPDGKPIGPTDGYRAELAADPEYQLAILAGQAARVDPQLQALPQQVWRRPQQTASPHR